MPDVPRDPRQLARDILAGKISIEELAREQQRRRSGTAPVPQPPRPQARGPQIQINRPPPPPQRPVQQPQRPFPPRPNPQPQRPVARKPVPPPPKPVQRQVTAAPPTAQARGPQVRPVSQPITAGQSAIPVAEARGTSMSQTVDNRAKPASTDRPLLIRNLRNRSALRSAIVAAEILNKPLALREDTPFQ